MYAQQNYPQQLGNGNYTIAEAGCLLTAICNGLERINGSGPDPVTLNQFYLERGLFIKDSDGANEDLAWGSINQYDPTIILTQVGSGALPPSENAIVKFHYIGVHTGQPIDHYCWVDHIEGQEVFIIDSWDGLVKGPAAYDGVYHAPIAWGVYAKTASTPPPPASLPAAPASAPSLDDMYPVIKEIPGYPTSGTAAAHTGSNSTVPAGNYHVFNRFNGMVNVTRILGQPGWWINPTDNVPSVTPPPAPPVVAPPVQVAPTPTPEAQLATPAWQTTYQPFRNKFGDVSPQYYVAMLRNYTLGGVTGVPVVDLESKLPEKVMPQYSVTPISGLFTYDGISYARPQSATNKFLWYGIPVIDPATNTPNIELESEVYSTATDSATHQVTKTVKPYDYVVLAAANAEKAYDKIEKVFDIFKPKKK